MDRILDCGSSGPLFLQRREIAMLVADAVGAGESRFHRYALHAFVVMPNHVHLLVTPNVAATRWLGPWKGFTAHQANRILGTRAGPFGKRKARIIWSGPTPSSSASASMLSRIR